jgi:ribulose-5-phosphate 4-epimerase/fuculose-1-phosphate aldolase
MRELEARQEICRVGKSLFDRGYVHSTAGNISVALDEADGGGFLITPTDACLGFLEPHSLAKLDDKLVQIGGDRASKTIVLHQKIYDTARALGHDVRSILHTHSTHAVAMSLQPAADVAPFAISGDSVAELLPPITPYFVMKVGHVPLIAYRRPGDAAAAEEVVRMLREYASHGLTIRAAMLARLGPVVWHRSPAAAMATLEELEETARLCLLALLKLTPLSSAAIQSLRDGFSASW